MADDMGYSDIGCYGGEIQTPVLDRLAGDGLRFTQFYNTGRCCPTRASLLTGLYQHQTGVGSMMGDRGLEGYRGDLNDHTVTIAQVLSGAGYTSYMSGKWHVTPFHKNRETQPKHNWPLQRGFDRFFGTIHGAGSYYDPNSLAQGNERIPPHKTGSDTTNENFYYTDAISKKAARYVQQHRERNEESPFFMYVSYTAPHWPLHAPEEAIQQYEGVYDEGWDKLRRKRYERMQQMGLLRDDWRLSNRAGKSKPWEQAKHKDWQARRMAVYAAQISRMDEGIGRIVGALKRSDQLDNTLLLFLSDNGGADEQTGWVKNWSPDPPENPEPMDPDTLQDYMGPPITRDGRVVRYGNDPTIMPGPADTYQSYGPSWGNLSNTPFRRYKKANHEGGIATPLIAHWPNGIDRNGGALDHQPAHLIDIMATCVDLSGATYPKRRADSPIRPMEGVSLTPAFRGNSLKRRDGLFFEHNGNRAVRSGQWKLVAYGRNGVWQLYNMRVDRTETNDLAAEKPELARDLAAEWEAWARRAHVLPWSRKSDSRFRHRFPDE